MKETTENPRPVIRSLVLTPELDSVLKEMARREGRSVSNLIRHALDLFVRERTQQQGEAAA